MLSPSRDRSAVLPSGRKAIPLGPAFGLPRSSLPTGVSRLPAMLKIETVPSVRLATRASFISGENRTVAPAPACSD